jgi:hypothetical protein
VLFDDILGQVDVTKKSDCTRIGSRGEKELLNLGQMVAASSCDIIDWLSRADGPKSLIAPSEKVTIPRMLFCPNLRSQFHLSRIKRKFRISDK